VVESAGFVVEEEKSRVAVEMKSGARGV